MKKYIISLRNDEFKYLTDVVNKGRYPSRTVKKANMLLMSNNKMTDKEISQILFCHKSTVKRVRKKYAELNDVDRVIYDELRLGQPKKLSSKQEAELIAIASSNAPRGRVRWTIDLLLEEIEKKNIVTKGHIKRAAVAIYLKKAKLSLGKRSHGVSKK